jgi:hypothetical protein
LSWAGLEPGPSAPQNCALTTRPAGQSLGGTTFIVLYCIFIMPVGLQEQHILYIYQSWALPLQVAVIRYSLLSE